MVVLRFTSDGSKLAEQNVGENSDRPFVKPQHTDDSTLAALPAACAHLVFPAAVRHAQALRAVRALHVNLALRAVDVGDLRGVQQEAPLRQGEALLAEPVAARCLVLRPHSMTPKAMFTQPAVLVCCEWRDPLVQTAIIAESAQHLSCADPEASAPSGCMTASAVTSVGDSCPKTQFIRAICRQWLSTSDAAFDTFKATSDICSGTPRKLASA